MIWLVVLPLLTLAVALPMAHWLVQPSPRRKPLPPPTNGRTRVEPRSGRVPTGKGLYEL